MFIRRTICTDSIKLFTHYKTSTSTYLSFNWRRTYTEYTRVTSIPGQRNTPVDIKMLMRKTFKMREHTCNSTEMSRLIII